MEKTVVELFAGVGGFRVGLNEVKLTKSGKVKEKNNYKFVWSNQWEPSTNVQHAFDCYVSRFGNTPNHVNEDISKINKKNIPDHTLLVGGFPCQDYSVARSLSKEKGIEGKKGVLWWQIRDILEAKQPPFVLLENVDRLLKSPSTQRGRDFGIMLRSFHDLGYGVEWRVINAADYGHPQRRRRILIYAFHNTTKYYQKYISKDFKTTVSSEGLLAKAFPIRTDDLDFSNINLLKFKDLVDMTNRFEFAFQNSGIITNGIAYTAKTIPQYIKFIPLNKTLLNSAVNTKLFIDDEKLEKFRYLKGSKRIPRVNKVNGKKYIYSEGQMTFPEDLSMPGRTMLTSEGSLNRSTHVVSDLLTNKLRIIDPIEAERLNEFPDNWTNTGMPEKRRYFMMGNALVCGLITTFGKELSKIIEKENEQ
jgi:DNA (cytosine-5)-methyltransferase 1